MGKVLCGIAGPECVPIGLAIAVCALLCMVALAVGVWLGSNWECK
jgi:hypothetical protein